MEFNALQVMNLTMKLMQPDVLKRIEETDFDQTLCIPYIVELDPTGVCDLACPGCISEEIVHRGNSFTRERLLTLGQEMVDSGVKGVILIGGGEPLAHPSAGELIALLGRQDVHVGITTNGSFIHKFLPAIAEFSSWTRVSMDASNEDSFLKLRPSKGGKSKFNKIVHNMELLAAIKRGKLGYSFLIQTEADGIPFKHNCNEIYDAARLAKEIGCDYFEVKPSYAFRGGIPHALQIHDPKYMAIAEAEIGRLADLEDENFQILSAINLKYSIAGVSEPQAKRYQQCPSTYLRTTVTSEGTYVCPYWRDKEDFKFGNCAEDSFDKVMLSDARRETVSRLDASKTCGFHCLRNDTNHEVIRLKESSTKIVPVEEFDRFI